MTLALVLLGAWRRGLVRGSRWGSGVGAELQF